LLDHWRDRIDQGIPALVWVPTCPLFQDDDDASDVGRSFRRAVALAEDESDEEVFILPQSDDIDEEESGSNDHEHSYGSPPLHDPFEGVVDATNASHQDDNIPCEHFVHFIDLCTSHMFHPSAFRCWATVSDPIKLSTWFHIRSVFK
jgi:hypothetical protein